MKFTLYLFLLFHFTIVGQIYEYQVDSETKIEYFIIFQEKKIPPYILYYSINKLDMKKREMSLLESVNSSNDFSSMFIPEVDISYQKKVDKNDTIKVFIDGINCENSRISLVGKRLIVDSHFETQIDSINIKKDSALTISITTFLPNLKTAYPPTYLFNYDLKSFPNSLNDKQEFKEYCLLFRPNLEAVKYNFYNNHKTFKKQTFEKYIYQLYVEMRKIKKHKKSL